VSLFHKFLIGRKVLECFCWEHDVPLVLWDPLCTVKLLRALADVLWQKAVLVLMTNENILSRSALLWNKIKMSTITEARILNYGCPVPFFSCFINISKINNLNLLKYNYNEARSSWIDHNKHTSPRIININDAYRFY